MPPLYRSTHDVMSAQVIARPAVQSSGLSSLQRHVERHFVSRGSVPGCLVHFRPRVDQFDCKDSPLAALLSVAFFPLRCPAHLRPAHSDCGPRGVVGSAEI
eukprot:TRINITY_DN13549_c0_g1_i3.p2 TRINITY_DN13549_c0_g1~~TRINITY_DN13549_c0_g1_i3.p2  ORF type:complete len:101 (-),score=2.45 TRINITY_DN13549_c0_g1_i3:59-361(-)